MQHPRDNAILGLAGRVRAISRVTEGLRSDGHDGSGVELIPVYTVEMWVTNSQAHTSRSWLTYDRLGMAPNVTFPGSMWPTHSVWVQLL